MSFQINAILSQGIGLPKFSQTAKVQNVVTLSKWQQGWRIKHPQAMTYKGQSAPNPPFLATCRGSIRIWGHGSGAKENAPAVLAYVSTALRLPDPPMSHMT